ncbi:hypothetical protein ACHHYP_09268 [Achlya hypogyna]|uniref:Uncharacterized protein n=1 Tax=Achlya hypogyna TaxID=1202772 RepID=A0A1V9ZJ42_ACHHY|nr:hypothetical protein ACHHYP_09268 [Achlya hypogyna]
MDRRRLGLAITALLTFGLAFIGLSLEIRIIKHREDSPLSVYTAQHGSPAESTPAPVVLRQLVREEFSLAHTLDPTTHVHLVFTTSCKQSLRFFLSSSLQISLSRVGHRGPLTEIVLGCSSDEMALLAKLPTFYYDFRFHFAPDFSHQGDDHYTPYNKPFGIRHFLHHAARPDNLSVALIDADYVFFKPLRINTGAKWAKYYETSGTRRPEDVTDTVVDGTALAQNMKAFLGGRWFNDYNSTMKNIVCGSRRCANVSTDDAFEYYEPAGTPYIMTRSDWHRFAEDYVNFTVVGRQYQEEWMVEMYAYGAAAANQDIKHTLLKHLGPATPDYNATEYWDFLPNSTANPCLDAFEMVLPQDPPVGIHYAMYYGADDKIDAGYWYSKHRVPNDFTECDAMLLELPPPTEWTKIDSMELSEKERQGKRHNVWLECTLTKFTNQVATEIKSKMCPLGFNTHRGISLDATKTAQSAYAKSLT